jgi:hypothetical protein
MKYGFIYIWRDKKHKRYYIGCHWGREDDGYICSSSWMKQAYEKRSQDFKRRILKTNIFDKNQTLLEEQYWLNMIKKEEIKPISKYPRYYNLQIINNKKWYMQHSEEIIKKISIKTKEAMQRPEVRDKYLEGLKTRDQSFMERETFKNSRQGGKKNKGRKHKGQALENMKEAAKNKIIPAEVREKYRIQGLAAGKKLCARRKICTKCGFEGTPLNIGRYHNEKCRMIDWISIKSDFIERKISIRKIALKYNIDHKTIINKATKENWN